MSMSIRASLIRLIFVMSAALAANTFAVSNGCSTHTDTHDTNILLQAYKSTTSPKDEKHSLGKWERYRRRQRWCRQYYAPETITSTTVAVTTTTSTTTICDSDCSGEDGGVLIRLTQDPRFVDLTEASLNVTAPGVNFSGCCCIDGPVQLTMYYLTFGITEDNPPKASDLKVKIRSPVRFVQEIPQATRTTDSFADFQMTANGLPASDAAGPWEVECFYPSEWVVGEAKLEVYVVLYLKSCN